MRKDFLLFLSFLVDAGYPVFKRGSSKRGKETFFCEAGAGNAAPDRKGKQERNGEPSRAAKEKDLHSKDKFIKAGETALMIGSGSFCTVEGVKVSAFGFSS